MAIKHAFTSGKSDGADATLVQPSSWNANHTIDAATVTKAMIENVANQRVLGRNTAGAGASEEVTASQLLDWVSNTNGVLLTRTGGTWGAVANVTTDNGDLQFADNASPVAPSSTKTKLFGTDLGGRPMLATLNALGAKMLMQPSLAQQHMFCWTTGLNNGVTMLGMVNGTATGTATGRTPTTTNSFTLARRVGFVSAAGAASVGGFRCVTAFLTQQQGYHAVFRFGIGDASIITTGRMFVGLEAATGAPSDVDPSGLTNLIGVGCDANDTTLQLYCAAGSAQPRTSLGANFPTNTANVDIYELALYAPPGGTSISYQVTRLNTGHVASGTISSNVPAATTMLTPQIWRTNGATATAVGIDLISLWGDTDI